MSATMTLLLDTIVQCLCVSVHRPVRSLCSHTAASLNGIQEYQTLHYIFQWLLLSHLSICSRFSLLLILYIFSCFPSTFLHHMTKGKSMKHSQFESCWTNLNKHCTWGKLSKTMDIIAASPYCLYAIAFNFMLSASALPTASTL